ncbi:MAG: hypothetical protein HYV51_02265 [Parcubacteria group bacterium]|nr:hypothetical protein [Parcubacteria group bacterium]
MYLILYQAIGFFSGLMILSFLIFLTFWQNFLTFRRAGELIGLKSKKQIFVISVIFVLGFSELIWSISFMPFPFYILGGILSVIFAVTLDIYREYFGKPANDNLFAFSIKIKKVIIKDIVAGIALITIFILISSWLPPKVY